MIPCYTFRYVLTCSLRGGRALACAPSGGLLSLWRRHTGHHNLQSAAKLDVGNREALAVRRLVLHLPTNDDSSLPDRGEKSRSAGKPSLHSGATVTAYQCLVAPCTDLVHSQYVTRLTRNALVENLDFVSQIHISALLPGG